MTLVGSLRFTMSSSVIMSADGRIPRGAGVMCTSQSLVSKAHDGPLHRLNHAYDDLRCDAPTVSEVASLDCQTMVCRQNYTTRA